MSKQKSPKGPKSEAKGNIQFVPPDGYPLNNLQTKFFMENAVEFFRALNGGSKTYIAYLNSPRGKKMGGLYDKIKEWREEYFEQI